MGNVDMVDKISKTNQSIRIRDTSVVSDRVIKQCSERLQNPEVWNTLSKEIVELFFGPEANSYYTRSELTELTKDDTCMQEFEAFGSGYVDFENLELRTKGVVIVILYRLYQRVKKADNNNEAIVNILDPEATTWYTENNEHPESSLQDYIEDRFENLEPHIAMLDQLFLVQE